MDVNVRNNLYFDYTDMIRRIMRRNRLLLYALRLDKEDVFQELSIVALMAIEAFDPSRSSCMEAHVWMKLQYAVLTMKQKQQPGGLTGLDGVRPVLYSLEYAEELGHTPVAYSTGHAKEYINDRLRKAIARLDAEERQVVLYYLDGTTLRKKTDKACFAAALEKLKAYYTSAQSVLA